jgi:ribosome-binding protein aMBF1 (putative translation factor)
VSEASLDTNAAATTIAQIARYGVNAKQLAQELQISPATVRRWARGACEPRYSEGLWLQQKLAELVVADRAPETVASTNGN